MPQFENPIDIMCAPLSTTSTSGGGVPTDGSTGMIEWDSTKYTAIIAFYFEAVLEIVSAGANPWVRALLYSVADAGTVPGSVLQLSDTVGVLTTIRSPGIIYGDIADGGAIYPRIYVNAGTTTGKIHQARIIIFQSFSAIASTRIFIPVGWSNTHNSTTYTEKESKRYLIDPANWDGSITARLHGTIKTANAANAARLNLRDLTTPADVVNISTIGTTPSLQKTTFTFPTTTKEYTTQLKVDSGTVTVTSYNAHIILDITGNPTKFELSNLVAPDEDITANTNFAQAANSHVKYSDPADSDISESGFRGFKDVSFVLYYEACLKSSNVVGVCQSELRADQKMIAKIESFDTAYVRSRYPYLVEAPSDGVILRSYYRTTNATGAPTHSSARLIMVCKFILRSDFVLPLQILTKQISDAILPVEILKKIVGDSTLPIQIQTQVIAPDPPITTDTTILRADAAGVNTGLSPHGSGDNYFNVGEVSADDDVGYNEGGSGSYDLYEIDHHSILDDKKIRQIQIFARVKGETSGNLGRIVYAIPAQSGTVYEMPYAFSLTTSYANYSYVVQRNPVSGNLWTQADIDQFQIGWKSETSGATTSRVTQIWCVVTFELPI